jgi:hypothetical protein
VDTLLQLGLSNALMATLLAGVVAGLSRVCRRPTVVQTLWLLVLLKLITPSPLVLPVSWPAPPNSQQSAVQGQPEGLPAASRPLTFDPWSAAAAWPERSWGPLVVTVWLAGSALWFALAGIRCMAEETHVLLQIAGCRSVLARRGAGISEPRV